MVKKAHFPGVNTVKDRHGKAVYYHRKTKIRLPDEFGSAEFAVAWAKAEASVGSGTTKKINQESYLSLVTAYQSNTAWTSKAPRTQADYQRVIDWMLAIGAGDKPAKGLTQARCEGIIEMGLEAKGWRFGKYVLEFNRMLYNWVLKKSARQAIWGKYNPWVNIPIPERPRDLKKMHRAWTAQELATVLQYSHIGLARVFILGLCGFDGSTMYPLKWDDYKEGRLEPQRTKTDVSGHSIVPSVLRPIMDDPDRPSEYIVTNSLGKHYRTLNSMQTNVSRVISALTEKGLVNKGLTLHGLRHTVGKIIADGGGGLEQIKVALQHKTSRMALHYSAEADKKAASLSTAPMVDDWLGLQNTSSETCKTPTTRKKKDNDFNG